MEHRNGIITKRSDNIGAPAMLHDALAHCMSSAVGEHNHEIGELEELKDPAIVESARPPSTNTAPSAVPATADVDVEHK